MLIQNARISFPNIFVAKAFEEGKPPKYNATFILQEGDPQIEKLLAACEQAKADKWGANIPADSEMKEPFIRDGITKAHLAGFGKGTWYFNASNDVRPTLLDVDKTPLVQSDGRPYAGCFVDVFITPWAQGNKYGKRINANLGGIQFRGHGEAFGGGSAVDADVFEDHSGDTEGQTVGDEDDFLD